MIYAQTQKIYTYIVKLYDAIGFPVVNGIENPLLKKIRGKKKTLK